MSAARIDKWLWAVRLCPTRQLATDACRLQRVKVNGQPVKPSREVKPDEKVELEQEDLHRTVRVLAIPHHRVGAKLVPTYLADLTGEDEYERAARARRERALNRVASPPVKPEKRDRRRIERFLEEVRRGAPPDEPAEADP